MRKADKLVKVWVFYFFFILGCGNADAIPVYKFNALVQKGDLKGVREAIDSGYDVNQLDVYGNDSLSLALLHYDCIALLIKHGVNVNHKKHFYYGNSTPLHVASTAGNINAKTVKLLLDNGADPFAIDTFGMLPLDYAKRWDAKEKIVLLKKRMKELESQPPKRKSPVLLKNIRYNIQIQNSIEYFFLFVNGNPVSLTKGSDFYDMTGWVSGGSNTVRIVQYGSYSQKNDQDESYFIRIWRDLPSNTSSPQILYRHSEHLSKQKDGKTYSYSFWIDPKETFNSPRLKWGEKLAGKLSQSDKQAIYKKVKQYVAMIKSREILPKENLVFMSNTQTSKENLKELNNFLKRIPNEKDAQSKLVDLKDLNFIQGSNIVAVCLKKERYNENKKGIVSIRSKSSETPQLIFKSDVLLFVKIKNEWKLLI